MKLSVGEVCQALESRCGISPDTAILGVAIDSRALDPGFLFLPIVAERDGHDFVMQALDAGAAAYLTERPDDDPRAIRVADSAAALTALGTFAGTRMSALKVGITGSVGKTTVKDLCRFTVGSQLRVHTSPASFNNELGVPLTLLNCPELTDVCVVEMGARGLGHIAALVGMAQPEVGVVTRVAGAHMEMFGNIESVAAAKGELVALLDPAGTAILNMDDERVAAMAERTEASVLGYGTTAGEVRGTLVSLDGHLRPTVDLDTPWGSARVRVPLSGEHQVGNALAALAVAFVAGVDFPTACAGLEAGGPSHLRMEVINVADGLTVINDCYNANPTSMSAALVALEALGVQRRIGVLGEMAELGEQSASEHRMVVAHAEELGIEVLGVNTGLYGGKPADDLESVVTAVQEAFREARANSETLGVLVKGSRVTGLERVVEALRRLSSG